LKVKHEKKLTDKLRNYIQSLGVDLFGFAELKKIDGVFCDPPNLLTEFLHGISIGLKLSDKVIEGIVDKPTSLYLENYRNLNLKLDEIVNKITGFINENGFKSYPIYASFTIKPLKGKVSHKAIARASGLGWIGKSALLINPKYGPRIRFASILTDMPLITGSPIKYNCGDCIECVKACPAKAITPNVINSTLSGEIYDVKKCFKQLLFFQKQVEELICGICIKVCPFGQ